MAVILEDAATATSSGGVSQGWARSPYGVRLVEDPEQAFKTLMEVEQHVLEYDGTATDVASSVRTNVQQWFNILENTQLAEQQAELLNRDGYEDVLADGKSLYASPNYTDTRVGGNDAINPYWQFNRDDDIVPPLLKMPGFEAFSSGMGRVYAEMYDDNQEILWMRMGVPEFVNVLSFYTNSGDANAATAMNTGTIRGLVGKIVKLVISTTIWAITLPILAPRYLYRWMSHLNSDRITAYYYFKPAMTLYYEMVNSMLSYLAVGMGLYPFWWLRRADRTKVLQNGTTVATPDDGDVINNTAPSEVSVSYEHQSITAMNIDEAAKAGTFATNECGIPEILKNGPDIFLIMNRRAMLFNSQRVKVTTRQLLEEQLASDQTASQYYQSPDAQVVVDKDGNVKEKETNEQKGVFAKTFSALKGTMFGAGDYVGFRLERGVNCTESVSNQTGPTSIGEQLNSYAQSKRDLYNASSGGNLLLKGAIAFSKNQTLPDFLKQIGISFAARGIAAVGIGDLAKIMTDGSGFIDIPEVWKGSSFSKNYSFQVQLRARYGDPTSIFQSVYIPLIMLLCAALPRSVGDNMYTSPFLVSAYCKGKFAISNGLITDMSISRGKDDFGWSNTNLPTAIDVSFSIRDLSPAVFLSMSDIGLFDTFTRNTSIMDYLDTMSALGLYERTFAWPKMMRKLTAACLIKKNTIFSATYWGSRFGRSPIPRALANVFPYVNLEQSDLAQNTSRTLGTSETPTIE